MDLSISPTQPAWYSDCTSAKKKKLENLLKTINKRQWIILSHQNKDFFAYRLTK